ncbi:lipopolysaccharide kinase InaA family protein, partial [Escherichia coli]|uniref:lipopolysaccharide kinase InaA family protein n=1 Tax=Escherichia coli TaxID=562 RepID=UPI00135573DE
NVVTTRKEISKNLRCMLVPILGSERAGKAVLRGRVDGVDTMYGVAFGEKGMNRLTRTSVIMSEDLTPPIRLEDYCAAWATNPP